MLPRIEDAEALQGFPRGWTEPAAVGRRQGERWKAVGNAVTVGVADWVGRQLAAPAEPPCASTPADITGSWPTAAWGDSGQTHVVTGLSEYPTIEPYQHLRDEIDVDDARPLSARAANGFLSRASRSTLRFDPDFLSDLTAHAEVMAGGVEQLDLSL